MKMIIDPANAVYGNLLHMKINGFCIEVSELSISEKIAVTNDSGIFSIEIVSVTPKENPLFGKPKDQLLADIHESKETDTPIEAITEIENISNDILFQKLVSLRKQIAREVNLPPYIIFHDTTLKDMSIKMPVDLEEFKDVSGVGETKLKKYGVRFVDVIKGYLANSA